MSDPKTPEVPEEIEKAIEEYAYAYFLTHIEAQCAAIVQDETRYEAAKQTEAEKLTALRSAISKEITRGEEAPAESPFKTGRCSACGGISKHHPTCNLAAAPSEEPQELTEALDSVIQAAKEWEWARMRPDEALVPDTHAQLASARSAISALFLRQQEEIEATEKAYEELAEDFNQITARCADFRAQLEQLKANLPTHEEARFLVLFIEARYAEKELTMGNAAHIIMGKLRSLSDSGNRLHG